MSSFLNATLAALRILGVLLGLATGIALAFLASGAWGFLIGPILGLTVGILVAMLPQEIVLAVIRSRLRRIHTNTLKDRLAREACLSHLIITELVSRGEPKEQFRGYVETLLQSESAARRRMGRLNQRTWFAD